MTTHTDIADYISSMATELANLARTSEGLTVVAAMLDKVAAEAHRRMAAPINAEHDLACTH